MADTNQPAQGRRLQGRVAIVTGASRGLGRSIALAFAREGAAVAVAARTEQVFHERLPGTIHETVGEITAGGGQAIAVQCDVTQDQDLLRLVEDTRAKLGPIDILVNNAAVTVPGRPGRAPAPGPGGQPTGQRPQPTFLDFPLRGYRLHFEVNVFAAYRLMQLVLPGMIDIGRGSVINVSSDAAHRPGEGPYKGPVVPQTFAYGGSKTALQHLTQAVAYEMSQHGIAVNCLLPSIAIATPGMTFFGIEMPKWGSEEAFAEATICLALETPKGITGRIAFSEDILHPDLGRRGWIGR